MKKVINIIYFLIILFQFLFSDLNAQWVKTNTQFNSQFYKNVWALTVNGKYLFAGTNNLGIYRSSDDGNNWTQINNGLLNLDVRALVTSDSNIFAGTMGGGIFISSNNGNSWIQSNKDLTNTNIISLAKNDNYIFAGTYGSGVFLSTDNGATWFGKNTGLTYTIISSIIFKDTSIFVGTQSSSNPNQGGHIFRSYKDVTNWINTSNGLPDKLIMSLTKTETDLFAAINDYSSIYKSTDNGENWNIVNNGLPARLPRSLITYKGENKNYLFVGNAFYPDPNANSQAVFFSDNDGISWNSVSDGLPNLDVWSFAIKGQYLFAGTDSTIYRRELTEMITSIDDKKAELPNQIHLSQNYPNPFNPTTIITFDIPARSHITLTIFDLLGNEVSTLLSKELSAGTHSYQWNATGFPSGVYFYQLRAGSYIKTKKLLYLK